MLFIYVIYYFIKLCTRLFTDNNNDDNIIINIDYLLQLLFAFTSYNGCKFEKLQWTSQNVNLITYAYCTYTINLLLYLFIDSFYLFIHK